MVIPILRELRTRLPATGNRKPINVLVIAAGIIPSLVIGILRPMLSLERAGLVRWQLSFEGRWTVDDIRRADVVIFCRNQSNDAYTALLVAKTEGKKVIFEIDDNFFEIPIGTSLGRHHRQPHMLHTTRRMFELADVTRVYSGGMADLAHSFRANVYQTKAYFDQSIIDKLTPKREAGRIKIAFATGRSADPVLERSMEEALLDIIERYPDRVQIDFWRKPSKILSGRSEVRVHSNVPDYNAFVKSFYEEGYDIGLAPMLKTLFYESKTNTKFREYGACAVAGVYSRVKPYLESVVDGQTGILVENSREGWSTGIAQLIEDPQLRQGIAQNAAMEVSEHYNYSVYLRGWVDCLRSAKTSEKSTPDIKPLYYHRNIAIAEPIRYQAVRKLPAFQISSVRGSDWSGSTYFVTNILEKLASEQMVEGSVCNWLILRNAEDLSDAFLRTAIEAGIHLICDLRASNDETVCDVRAKILASGLHGVIIIVEPEQQILFDVAAETSISADVDHSLYPRPVRLPTSFGYLIFARRDSIENGGLELADLTLSGDAGLWLEIGDVISAIHPLGIPLTHPFPKWFLRLPGARKYRFARYLDLGKLSNALRVAFAARIYRLKWQKARWLFEPEGASSLRDLTIDGPPSSEHGPADRL